MSAKVCMRALALLLVLTMLFGATATAASYDKNGDDKINVWDLMLADDEDKAAALVAILGGKDELHKNDDGHWEIWTELGLRNMAYRAQSGDTFVLMQDIDLDGDWWEPIEDFNGHLIGNQKTISDMRITTDHNGNMGFFGSIAKGGEVEFLNLKDMNVIASKNATTIGLMAGSCAGVIDGCTTIGFVTDERTELPGTVLVGGMAGKVHDAGEIVGRDTNKLPEDGAEQPINTISSKIGTRFLAESGHTVGIVGAGESAVDTGVLLQDLTGKMLDPNAIAQVTTGELNVFPHTVEELIAAIDATGNSVVTLQEDISHTQAITLPYSCTFDCNGYTVATPADKNNGINITSVGSENATFTLKNGTLTHYEIGVCVKAGAVVLSDMTIVAEGGAPLGIYVADDYSAINRIENCTLVSKNWQVIAYNTNIDLSANGITIENSDLIAAKPSGGLMFGSKSDQPGTVTIGNNVNLYTYRDALTSVVPLSGIDPEMLDGTASVTVLGQTYDGLSRWTTDESVLTAAVMAEVTNGTETVEVTNATALANAINSDGNTKVKFVRDVVRSSQIKIPYSCHIDLNGFSITATAGSALQIAGVGTDNTVTTVENGTLNHTLFGICVDTGSLNLKDVNINGSGKCDASVAYYDPSGAYKEGNVIEGCVIYNPNAACIKFNTANVDFNETGIDISNTTLVAAKDYAFGIATSKMSGIVTLGEGVEIYSPQVQVGKGALYRFLGLVAYRTEANSVTVNDVTVTGVNHWSTDNQKDIIDILMIGNSYSTTIPQELYNIATNAGYEVNVANLYFPGCIAAEHWDWLNNDVANYQYRHQSQMGGYIRRGDNSTSKYALEDEEWDVIIYQDWFTPKNVVRESGYPCDSSTLEKLYACHQEAAYNMMQYLKTNYPNAEHYYYQHWAWQIGHSAIPDAAAANAMWERIDTASNKFADENDFILIPCGAAFQLARNDARIGEGVDQEYSLWDTDNSHDGGPGGGQFLNGCVFFETIFRESCTADTTWGESSTKLTDEQVAALRELAHQAVVDTHGEDWVK